MPVPNAAVANAIAVITGRATGSTLASLGRTSDFDGDGRSDLTVYRPPNGTWFTLRSSSGYSTSSVLALGAITDTPVAGDYDGDGRTDAAVYTPATGIWSIQRTSLGSITYQWGLAGDVPIPGDYDGDGKTDLAVFRPVTGEWFIRQSSTNFATAVTFQWGLNGDVPVPGDYDGDGKTDLGVYRPSAGTWFMRLSTTSYATSVSYQWGLGGDIPVPAPMTAMQDRPRRVPAGIRCVVSQNVEHQLHVVRDVPVGARRRHSRAGRLRRRRQDGHRRVSSFHGRLVPLAIE